MSADLHDLQLSLGLLNKDVEQVVVNYNRLTQTIERMHETNMEIISMFRAYEEKHENLKQAEVTLSAKVDDLRDRLDSIKPEVTAAMRELLDQHTEDERKIHALAQQDLKTMLDEHVKNEKKNKQESFFNDITFEAIKQYGKIFGFLFIVVFFAGYYLSHAFTFISSLVTSPFHKP